MKRSIELVIFDLDGTLVASESLAERVTVRVAREQLGLQLTESEIARDFRGRDIDFMLAGLEKRYGGPLPESYLPTLQAAYQGAVGSELVASAGVEEAIKAISPTPLCIASNGEPDVIAYCVDAVGLAGYFNGKYFSARQVARPKPAPDLFLHAAQSMGVEPSRCVVIEDTVLGVSAAQAANMYVVAYAGNHAGSEGALLRTGAPVIVDYADLAALIS